MLKYFPLRYKEHTTNAHYYSFLFQIVVYILVKTVRQEKMF